MQRWQVRPFREADLGGVLRLWERTDLGDGEALELGEAATLLRDDASTCMVATSEGEIAGTALAFVAGRRGWLARLAVAEQATDPRMLRDLVLAAVDRLQRQGIDTFAALAPPHEPPVKALEMSGFERHELDYFELSRPARGEDRRLIDDLGGSFLDAGRWAAIAGMEREKELIERRIILPLSESELARRHGVSTPRAIVLFGPPGTGKTTFAKAIAGRLDWPFVEMFPSELTAVGAERQALELRAVFERCTDLSSAVLFIDEVEDVAASREDERKVPPNVTNELLKQIPRFRDRPYRLLVCATNEIRRLDTAFLRPGRFDFVLPVGPPDDQARGSIWRRYLGEITDEDIDVGALVEASAFFTPADIEYAARKAAQRSFEREHFEGAARRAGTDDFLWAIRDTRPTLDRATIRRFEEDVEDFTRT